MRRIPIISVLLLMFIGCNKDDADEAATVETYKVFNSTNSPIDATTTDHVTALKIDESNNVWVGIKNQANILVKYDQSADTWTVFGDEAFGDSIGAVYSIDFDQDNNVWVGTNDGIFKYDGEDWTSSISIHVFVIPQLGDNVHVDRSNTVWCTVGELLHRYENGEWTQMDDFINTFPNYQIREIDSDEDGNVWFGTSQGIVKYDGTGFTQIEHEPQFTTMNTYAVEPAGGDTVWVGTIGGLYRLIGTEWQPIDDVSFENPGWDDHDWNVQAIALNQETGLFGTWNMGLTINQVDDFLFMRGNEFGIDTNRFQINELEYDLTNNLWIATRFGAVIVYRESGL